MLSSRSSFHSRRIALRWTALAEAVDRARPETPVLRLFFSELIATPRGVTRAGGGLWPVILMIEVVRAVGRMSYL